MEIELRIVRYWKQTPKNEDNAIIVSEDECFTLEWRPKYIKDDGEWQEVPIVDAPR